MVTGSIVGETFATSKLPPKPGLGKGKGLMTSHDPITEKHPFLFREDLRYTLKQLPSIIKDNDYEDLGNHTFEAMGETGLFILPQVCLSVPFFCFVLLLSRSNLHFLFLQGVIMMKDLMDRCAPHKTVMSHLKEKVEARKTELRELMAWKEV